MSSGQRPDLLFGKIALNKGYITATLLQQALQHQAQVEPHRHLGEILLARGLITQQQVQTVLQMQNQIAAARQAATAAEQSGLHQTHQSGPHQTHQSGPHQTHQSGPHQTHQSGPHQTPQVPHAPPHGVAPPQPPPTGQPFAPEQAPHNSQWPPQGPVQQQPGTWTAPGSPADNANWTSQAPVPGIVSSHAPNPTGQVGGGSGSQRADAVTLHGQGAPSATDSTDSEIDALLGQSLGGCLINACIGRGGMGAIYRAHHQALNKDVVVKVLPKKLAENPRTVERFLREAQAAARLEHSSIVAVHNVGSDAGLHYIIMQFVDGQDLAELILQKKRFAAEEGCRIVLRIAEGLAVAHDNGIIHRDIKAENILITQQGEVKIADFGLAKDLDSDVKLTSEGQIIGTPLYMAPEIGRVPQIDGRVDLYSLGVTFYFMLSGQQPFAAFNTLDVLSGRAHEQVKPLSDLCPDLPHEVTAIVERLMARDRDQRYGTANELIDDLLILVGSSEDIRTSSRSDDSSGRLKPVGRKSSGRLASVGIHRGKVPNQDTILGLPRSAAITLAAVASLVLGIVLLLLMFGG